MGTKNLYRYIFLIFLTQSTLAGTWESHKQNLQNLVATIGDLEGEVRKLIHEKRAEPDRAMQTKIMKEIQEKYKKLEETYKKYNEEISHVLYRHPEQGDSGERIYKILKPKTLEQMESDFGLDGKLDRIKNSMYRQYHQPPPPVVPEESKVQVKKKEEPPPKERIILRK